MKLRDFIPGLGLSLAGELRGAGFFLRRNASAWYVDGTSGSDSDTGEDPDHAFATIGAAVSAAGNDDAIYIFPKKMTAGATDPGSYAETVIIPAGKTLALVGVRNNRTQGGLPQIKKGSGSTALLTVRSPGCLISNLGFNGASSTGGGILLDDDGSTKTAFGTTITGCHFKNCVVTANNATTGGAIYTSSLGNAWQILVSDNRFYKNEGDIVVVGTGGSVPQDWVIENNIFGGPAASVDVNIYTGGSGVNGIIIRNNVFTAMPALSAGTVKRFMDLTGSVGILANNQFATITDPALTELQFAAAGSGAKVPATVFMAGNTGEVQATGNTSNQAAIGRYA